MHECVFECMNVCAQCAHASCVPMAKEFVHMGVRVHMCECRSRTLESVHRCVRVCERRFLCTRICVSLSVSVCVRECVRAFAHAFL